MLKTQKGASLVVALIMLAIITLVAAYSIEGTTIQSKMIANSLFSSLTYQECRNEQEASIRFYNENGGVERTNLLALIDAISLDEDGDPIVDDDGNTTPATIQNGGESGVSPITKSYNSNAAHSDISTTWSYLREEPAARGGYNIDTESQIRTYLYQNNCTAVFRFSTNNQILGAIVEGLVQSGNLK